MSKSEAERLMDEGHAVLAELDDFNLAGFVQQLLEDNVWYADADRKMLERIRELGKD